MIAHPAELDTAYGTAPVRPYILATFIDRDGARRTAVPIDGTWTSDDGSWPRTVCDLTIPSAITPVATVNPVSPFGGQLVVTIGAWIPGYPAPFTFQLGVLDVDTVTIDRPAGTIAVHAVSREARVNEDRFSDSDAFWLDGNATELVVAQIRTTLGGSYPVRVADGIVDYWSGVGAVQYGSDTWNGVEQVADQLGAEAWFDSQGTFVLRPNPVISTPAITLRGKDGGSLTGYTVTQKWSYNRLYLVYRAPTSVPGVYSKRIGVWQDLNPASITFAGAPYGPHTLQSEPIDVATIAALPTQAVADAAAAARARRNRATYRQITARAIPAPWLEPGDTVAINTLDGAASRLLLSRIQFPLGQDDVMQLGFVDDAYTTTPSFGG